MSRYICYFPSLSVIIPKFSYPLDFNISRRYTNLSNFTERSQQRVIFTLLLCSLSLSSNLSCSIFSLLNMISPTSVMDHIKLLNLTALYTLSICCWQFQLYNSKLDKGGCCQYYYQNYQHNIYKWDKHLWYQTFLSLTSCSSLVSPTLPRLHPPF